MTSLSGLDCGPLAEPDGGLPLTPATFGRCSYAALLFRSDHIALRDCGFNRPPVVSACLLNLISPGPDSSGSYYAWSTYCCNLILSFYNVYIYKKKIKNDVTAYCLFVASFNSLAFRTLTEPDSGP